MLLSAAEAREKTRKPRLEVLYSAIPADSIKVEMGTIEKNIELSIEKGWYHCFCTIRHEENREMLEKKGYRIVKMSKGFSKDLITWDGEEQ